MRAARAASRMVTTIWRLLSAPLPAGADTSGTRVESWLAQPVSRAITRMTAARRMPRLTALRRAAVPTPQAR